MADAEWITIELDSQRVEPGQMVSGWVIALRELAEQQITVRLENLVSWDSARHGSRTERRPHRPTTAAEVVLPPFLPVIGARVRFELELPPTALPGIDLRSVSVKSADLGSYRSRWQVSAIIDRPGLWLDPRVTVPLKVESRVEDKTADDLLTAAQLSQRLADSPKASMMSPETSEFFLRHPMSAQIYGPAVILGLAALFFSRADWWQVMLAIAAMAALVAVIVRRELRHATPRTPADVALSIPKPAGRAGDMIQVEVSVPDGQWVVGLVGYAIRKVYDEPPLDSAEGTKAGVPVPRAGRSDGVPLIGRLSGGIQTIQWKRWTTLEPGVNQLELRVPNRKAPTQRSFGLDARWEVRVAKGTTQRHRLTVGAVEPVLVLP